MSFTPSSYQKAIFDWFADPSGPIVVNAKAGSGKTTTLVRGMHEMKEPGKRLFAAFNKSIVEELTRKLPPTVQCQTIHSLGYATLRSGYPSIKRWDLDNGRIKYRQLARDVKIPQEYGDRNAIQDLLLNVVNYAQLTLANTDPQSIAKMANRFGLEIPVEVDEDWLSDQVTEMIKQGIELGKQGLISFADMLFLPASLNLSPPKYSLVAVDEAQDLSKVQMHLIMSAQAEGGNFIAVGDPRQAIYGFAGAESDSFYQLQRHFKASVMPLNYCYRCPELVIKEAQRIVSDIECPEGTRAGIVKTITDEEFKTNLRPGDMVLCRLTAPLVKLCFELIKRRIPAKVKGRDIGGQIANTVRQIMKRCTDLERFPAFMYGWQESQLRVLRDKLGSEDQQQAVADKVACLEICYAMFNPQTIDGFCDDIKSLFSDDKSPITLCTVHRAKGLENPRVFIIRPDKLPLTRKNQTADQANQEMNLKYVAITRAQEELYFVQPGTEDQQQALFSGTISGT